MQEQTTNKNTPITQELKCHSQFPLPTWYLIKYVEDCALPTFPPLPLTPEPHWGPSVSCRALHMRQTETSTKFWFVRSFPVKAFLGAIFPPISYHRIGIIKDSFSSFHEHTSIMM